MNIFTTTSPIIAKLVRFVVSIDKTVYFIVKQHEQHVQKSTKLSYFS
jgi:hypothetical protein